MKFIFLLVMVCTLGCTPKLVEVKPDTEEKEVVKVDPKGPCASFSDLPGYDRERAETAFVLYKDFLRAKKYDEALPYWKLAYALAPGSNGKVQYHFEDGTSIYKHLYGSTENASLKKTYIDTVMMIYDKKKECFGDSAYINGIKGFDYYYYYTEYTTQDKIFELLKSNIDIKGKNVDYFVVNPFTKMLFDRIVEGKISNEVGRKYADIIFGAIDQGKKTCKGTICEAWEIIDEYSTDRLESLEGIDDFYQCDYYSKKYYALYKKYPDSCDIINLAYSRMLRGNCATSDKKLIEVKDAKANKCYIPPPPLSCAAQGNEDYGSGKYSKAVESYLTCVDLASDADTKAKYLLLVAKIYYRDLRNYPKSRKYALEAAQANPGWGEPYMLIGNLYASSGPLCGPGRGWDSQVVTWPAIDMWTKAKNVDSKFASEANTLINRYKQYMPKKEDIFFRNIKEGNSYFVPCWIQENTTVRTAD
ncbi:MAG: hypothetical protein WAU01_02725 [Saprospiraceae bacterium]